MRGLIRRASVAALGVAVTALAAAPATGEEPRTITGIGNNPANPDWGSTGSLLRRMAAAAYSDGISALARQNLASARVISNAVMHQDTTGGVLIPDPRGLTDYAWAWGQFVDHDIDLSLTTKGEFANIAVPAGDPWFDPSGVGGVTLPFTRSVWDPLTGTGAGDPREQVNSITSYLDSSNVYGSNGFRATWLRAMSAGLMNSITDPVAGEMPPYNDGTMPNAGGMSTSLMVAGDVRANETTTLLALQTLMLREHNRLAASLSAANPAWTDEMVYQRARKIVGALMQHITYDEFLPALLGVGALPAYTGYDPSVDPTIRSVFSTAAYRMGHSMLSPIILRLDANGQVIAAGNLEMMDSFFNPNRLLTEGGLEPVFRGLAAGQSQRVDTKLNDDVRIHLFEGVGGGPPMDLAALNIQRGRDHGLPDYNTVRAAYGLPVRTTFDQISSDAEVVSALESVYANVDEIDPWIGMMAEDLAPGSSVGETIRAILVDQFTRLRDGDRFWYENDPDLAGDLDSIHGTRLADVIARNTAIEPGELQDNVFFLSCPGDLNGDGIVDTVDLTVLLAHWNTSSAAADLNGDGIVNGVDLAYFLNNLGSCLNG